MTPHHPSRLALAGALALAVALTSSADASADASAAASAAGPATGAHRGPALAQPGHVATKRRSTTKKVAKRRHARAVSRRGKSLSAASVADALAKLPTYSGPTGAVVHSRAVTVSFKTTDDPHESRGHTIEREQWAEIGGGARVRELLTFTDEDTHQPQSTMESWRGPWSWALISSNAPPSVAIFCTTLPALDPDPTLREDRGRLESLPAGPEIGGVATRVGVHPVPVPEGGPGTPAEFRNYLNAATGEPIRTTYRPYDTQAIAWQTDYRLWELLPAGGAAAALSGVLPADTELADDHVGQPGCIG